MKFIQALTAASLILASAQAMAFVPPYHITQVNNEPVIGIATIKSFGGCKVPLKKFYNAQYGTIKDSQNSVVGAGVIADGKILVIEDSGLPRVDTKNYSYDGYMIGEWRQKRSFVGPALMDFLASESGCNSPTAWPKLNSYFDIKKNLYTATDYVSIKQSFIGVTSFDDNCVIKGHVQNCTGYKFSGGFSFKGQFGP